MGKSRKDTKEKSDHKFEMKIEFYAQVRDTVATLIAKKSITKKKKLRSRQKKLKAYDLTTLSEFLPELKGPQKPKEVPEIKLNCKSKKQLILKEGKQFSTVLNHLTFLSDPLGSIHQHLESTQPPQEEKPKKKAIKDGGEKTKRKKSIKIEFPKFNISRK